MRVFFMHICNKKSKFIDLWLTCFEMVIRRRVAIVNNVLTSRQNTALDLLADHTTRATWRLRQLNFCNIRVSTHVARLESCCTLHHLNIELIELN